MNIAETLKQNGIVAVLRAKTHSEAKQWTEACRRGGIVSIEFTYSIPQVEQLIAFYADDPELTVGVGSVLTGSMARRAIAAGAAYVVSPGFSPSVHRVCARRRVLYLPGCLTVTEMMHAVSRGHTLLKLFPGDAFGPAYLKAVKAPLPAVELMPTGGVTPENASEWFRFGAACVGVGSSLFAGGDPAVIQARAAQMVAECRRVRGF